MTSCYSFFNQLALISTSCNTDNRYAVSNGTGYAVLIFWYEYAVLDRKLDTPYPMEVDMPYSTVDQNSGLKQWTGSQLDTLFIRSGSQLDTAHGYAVSSLMDMAYWSSEHLKALDEGYSCKNYVRKFLRALYPKWRAKVTTIEESKDLTSLSLDELIGNLKVHKMIIKKDSEIVKAKVERKSLALKAKKESGDEECSTFGSEDEEYAMENGKRDRKYFRCGDPNHFIGEFPKPPKEKNQRAFVEGFWSDSGEEDDEKIKDETCLVAHAPNEVCSDSSYFSDENSSIDDLALDNKYDKLCKMSQKIMTKNKRLKATRNSLENELRELKATMSTLEKNKGVDLDCVKCHTLKIKNEKLKEESIILNRFEKSTHCLNEILNSQKPSGEKLGLGFNSFEASSSGTKEINFMKAQKKASSDGGPINMGGPLNVQAAPKVNIGPPPGTTLGSEKIDLEPYEWIKDSGCSKHMTGNQKLFLSYKAYNGGNIIFGSNLRGNIIGKGQICDNKCRVTFSEHDIEITKDGKVLGRGIRKKAYIKQAHASHKAKNIVSTTRCLELLHMDLFGPSAIRSYGGNRYTLVIVDDYSSKAYIIQNKHTRRVEELLNVTFDETPPPSKTSPLVDGDLDEEEAIKVTEKKNLENDIVDETLEIDEIVNIKESRNHPLENVIGNLNQRTLRSQAQNQSNFFCFISTIEPKNVNEALTDDSWIVAIQEELNQFIANDVWELVAQGYNQQEGIDCDETYALVARLESIRILLAYACALDFKLFQMDVKSAFLDGFINEEVYVAQPPGFIDFEKPNHVYKLKKVLYGLKQAPKAWPDIMFSVCLCARFQEAPKTSHLEVVKCIFRYIKGTTYLGLWYPKGTGIEIVVYANSDHAGDYVDRKSTSEFAQIIDIPCDGACVFSDRWSIDELVYGVPTDGPYQTNLPSPEDIISSIRIDREGQVRRIRHEEEINVLEY
ncbi:retrovirus-related pol polyprotein from transposon TNT 1-94 [Tanacetum coccineum]